MARTFEADTRLECRVVPGLAFTRKALKKRDDYRLIVVHTTGAGIPARFKREGKRKKDATPLDTAARVYRTISKFCAHYIVGQDGGIVQCVPEELAAQHVGGSRMAQYKWRGWRKKYKWWPKRWPDLNSPLDLTGGKSANGQSVGIEVVAPLDDPRGPWSEPAWKSLSALVRDIGKRRHIPRDRLHVVSHSDLTPHSRTARGSGQPWDPGPRQWDGFGSIEPWL